MKTVFSSFTLGFSVAFLLFWAGQTGANTLQKMLQIDCDGTLSVSLPHEQQIGKYSLGDIARGMLYGRLFFSIDDDEIIATDLDTEEISSFGKNFPLEKNYKPWLIGYVDNEKIIFSAQGYDPNLPIDKQLSHYYLYQIDRRTKSLRKLSIDDCGNANFSFHGNDIFYTNEKGMVCKFHDGKATQLDFKGTSPTISPDGKKLAYISFGVLKYGIHIYEFKTRRKKTTLRLGEAWPIIRWDSRNRYLAVKKRSDIFSNTLYVVDILNNSNKSKFENNHACNWFFVDNWSAKGR
jgi:hypothetical protein